jgi:hypothetical protein
MLGLKSFRSTVSLGFDQEQKNNETGTSTFINIAETIQVLSAIEETTTIPRTFLPNNNNNSTSKRYPRLDSNKIIKNFIVIPEYKLLFCYIEKNGCGMFNHLFRMLRLLNPFVPLGEAQRLAEGYWDLNGPKQYNLTLENLQDLLVDPAWTKAVFYRDPIARMVSGFRSKCGKVDKDYYHCLQAFDREALDSLGSPAGFQKAVDKVQETNTERVFHNPHFKPMVDFCGGLEQTLEHYDFVQALSPTTGPQMIQTLLQKIGVDVTTIDYLIDNVVVQNRGASDEDAKVVQGLRNITLHGDHKVLVNKNNKSHSTGTEKGSVLRDYVGSQQRLEFLLEIYHRDYDLFRIPKPSYNML